jgi:ABC-type nitrate/sulfonate/bicarbonate transport system substrate-binding protein
MKAFTCRFGATIAALTALAFCVIPALAQEPLKLRFGKLGPNLGMARAEIAETQGFFKKRGLDVEITQFRASPELLTAVVSGSIDIAVSGITSVITAQQRDLPLKALFIDTTAPFYYLLASPDIASLQDAAAKGATAGVSGIGSLDYVITRYLVKRAGVDPDKIKYVQAGTPVQRTAALEAGRLQLAVSVVPEIYPVLRRGKVKVVSKMSDYAKDFALETVWAKEDYIASHGEAVRRFLAAMDDAADWIRTSPEAPAALAKFIGLSYPEAQADVKRALEEIRYPTVAEHKANLNSLLMGNEPLVDDALARQVLKADSARLAIDQLFDTRYVR